jgi:hypothetical protein
MGMKKNNRVYIIFVLYKTFLFDYLLDLCERKKTRRGVVPTGAEVSFPEL